MRSKIFRDGYHFKQKVATKARQHTIERAIKKADDMVLALQASTQGTDVIHYKLSQEYVMDGGTRPHYQEVLYIRVPAMDDDFFEVPARINAGRKGACIITQVKFNREGFVSHLRNEEQPLTNDVFYEILRDYLTVTLSEPILEPMSDDGEGS